MKISLEKEADTLVGFLKISLLLSPIEGVFYFFKLRYTIKTAMSAGETPEMRSVDYFFERFIPAFDLTLDELEGL